MLAGMLSVTQVAQGASTEIKKVTDIIEENESVSCGVVSQAETKIAIRVKLDRTDGRVIELVQGASVSRILEVVASERGCGIEELVLVREGEGEPLTLDLSADTGYPHQCRHHVHYLGEVKVTVFYQASQEGREFKRFEAVKDVLAWAIEAFKVDASLATELVLVRYKQKDELPEREHIGHLAGKDSDLALDLVRGEIANGSCA
ncbi:hypothetical protein [Candidatus Rariloculus sp.]|uniref:hypothetical protein n=1 Tax=Candidatus Rariloculus sp. TaxID=3101265 RepID=UPI003D0D581B